MYSVRMRSAQGGSHESGGRHISGAERIVSKEMIQQTTNAMLDRAFSHTRGQADFINIVVEKIEEQQVVKVPVLPVSALGVSDVEAGRKGAQVALLEAGVTAVAVESGMEKMLSLADSMRGAMLVCAVTGKRLDETGIRGIRVSRMDIADAGAFDQWLTESGIKNNHVWEALVLASKVATAPGVVAELCWSDDPEYTTGYVATTAGYLRVPHCKPHGSAIGGRVFFVKPDTDIAVLTEYLQSQPVLVTMS